MHILIFSAQYLPHMGGIENFTYNLSKKLIELGHTVTVVTNNTENCKQYEICEKIEVYRIPCHNFINKRYPVMKFGKEFKTITHKLSQDQFDFVIVNARFYLHSLFGVRFAKKKHIPSIVIDHGTSHLTVHNPILDFTGNCYEHALTKVIQLYCKDYYAVSTTSVEWLKHFHIQAKGMIHNAIDFNKIETLSHKSTIHFKEKYHIQEDDIVFSFTGRLIREKGILQLIDAFELLCKKYSNVYLMIAGDGELYEQLQKLHPHIILLGRLNFEEVVSLLKVSDVFVLPSDSEGFSTSILEAGACDCYIISTDTGGIREILLDDEYGYVMQDNNVTTIYQALQEVLDKKDCFAQATYLTKERILHNFTWDQSAKKVLEIIENRGN